MNSVGPIPHVVFTGGGTGGHLFPGLAVAGRLRKLMPGARVTFAGVGKPLEREQVAAAGWEYVSLRCGPWPRRLRDGFRFVLDNLRGYRDAWRFLRDEQVSAVVGLGGYTSGPMARAALGRGVPLVLLEQNVVPGRVTRWLAPRATIVCTSFAETQEHLPGRCRSHPTGNPIRDGFRLAAVESRRLLILGGSSGARALNEHVPSALAQVRQRLIGWEIVHQTGHADGPSTADRYRQLGLEATVVPFISDMPGTLAATGLAICRAGGTTLAELAAAAVPAILVPYPHAAGDHQRRNAGVLAARGACRIVDQREAPGSFDRRLAGVLSELLDDPSRRAGVGQALQSWAKPEAAREVAMIVVECLGG